MKASTETTFNKELRDRVERQLDWSPDVTSTDVGVAADNGVITLTGYVSTFSEKLAAETAALRTFGVKAVANDIVVKPALRITDTDLAARAVAAIESRANVPLKQVKVTVRDGHITLDGDVEWKYQKDSLESAVKHLAGARGLIDRIEVRPTVTPGNVKFTIEEAFRRNPDIDAHRLGIAVEDGKVELTGNVRSWFERYEAEQAAWSAPGVTRVLNHIHIVP